MPPPPATGSSGSGSRTLPTRNWRNCTRFSPTTDMRPGNLERRNLGFTLIEMVVTLLVAAVLFGLGATVISGGFLADFFRREIKQKDWPGGAAPEGLKRGARLVCTSQPA